MMDQISGRTDFGLCRISGFCVETMKIETIVPCDFDQIVDVVVVAIDVGDDNQLNQPDKQLRLTGNVVVQKVQQVPFSTSKVFHIFTCNSFNSLISYARKKSKEIFNTQKCICWTAKNSHIIFMKI